jgi:hypothetical protein
MKVFPDQRNVTVLRLLPTQIFDNLNIFGTIGLEVFFFLSEYSSLLILLGPFPATSLHKHFATGRASGLTVTENERSRKTSTLPRV